MSLRNDVEIESGKKPGSVAALAAIARASREDRRPHLTPLQRELPASAPSARFAADGPAGRSAMLAVP